MLKALLTTLSLASTISATPLLDLHPRQANISCPPTPIPLPPASFFQSIKTLPSPFVYLDSKSHVRSTSEWYQCRQPEILRLLQEYQYGYYPDHSLETITASRTGSALVVTVVVGGKSASISAALNLPAGKGPFPVVVSIGGMGSEGKRYVDAGIAVVGLEYGKVAADSASKTGAFWTLYGGRDIGVLTAWAWGVHRVLDGIELKVPEIDVTKSGVTGCSRLGKAALAAGLFDKRIAVTIPMCSGVQGAGPYRYSLSGQGENLENSKLGAPWWTSSGISQFINKATQLPFDAHTIVAAIAPRAVILEQNSGDQFTDSKGTAAVTFSAAKVVYKWLGVGDKLGMSIPSGGHCDMNGYADVLPFVQKTLQGKETTKNYDDLKTWKAMLEAYPWGTDLVKKA